MKDAFVKSCFNYISRNKKLDHYNQVKIKYGLEVMYHFFTKAFVILFLSFILKIFKENIFIFLFYGFIRIFAHGIHAKSNIQCWIYSMITYVFLGLYIKYIYIHNLTIILLCIISLISFILFAPADTKKLPLVNKKIRFKLKIKTLVIASIYTLLCSTINNQFIKEVICISMVLETILVNPILYKITGRKFNNYTQYRC